MTRREVSYLINYDTLLQNATDIITKCDSYFITKYDRSLLQNASGFFITKCNVYYKVRQYTHLLIRVNSPINVL